MRLFLTAPVALLALVWGSAPLGAAPQSAGEEPDAQTAGVTSEAPSEASASATLVRSEKSPIARYFSGSTFSTQTSANLNVFAPGLQLTQNPTVETQFWFAPRFVLRRDLALRARLGLGVEWTNSDFTSRIREPLLTDLVLDGRYTGIPAFLSGTRLGVGVQLGVPTSIESRVRTLVLAPALTLDLSHTFKGILGGKVQVNGRGAYQHNFYTDSTAGIRGERPYSPQCYAGATDCLRQLVGRANVHDALTWSLSASGEWGIVSPSFSFGVSHQFPYAFRDLDGVERDPTRTSMRVYSTVALGVDVELTKWLTGNLGYSMERDMIAGDGHYGNPFFDRYQDMRLALGLSVALDRFYEGVIR